LSLTRSLRETLTVEPSGVDEPEEQYFVFNAIAMLVVPHQASGQRVDD
jgi:hypothetical protein